MEIPKKIMEESFQAIAKDCPSYQEGGKCSATGNECHNEKCHTAYWVNIGVGHCLSQIHELLSVKPVLTNLMSIFSDDNGSDKPIQ